MIISINSHDVLGKLSIIKNYLCVLTNEETTTDPQRKLIAPAAQSAQELIDEVKQKAQQAKQNAPL